MKTRSNQLELSQYGLTEMDAQEMKATNGGGLIDGVWWAVWGSVYAALALVPGGGLLSALLSLVVGTPPAH
ncbi:MAG TPA: hypothetical protein VM802_02925 [Chitinophaga sp.]|uniref:hypothetical protein n=1 Tax=Chitinophaga sp. TaxID=1869181 RepID=UPI002C9B510B|nr:hypothetical protein [Chitinophaga sp.]HVI43790.1 hypothetical protein [Chitinophaga sp.]